MISYFLFFINFSSSLLLVLLNLSTYYYIFLLLITPLSSSPKQRIIFRMPSLRRHPHVQPLSEFGTIISDILDETIQVLNNEFVFELLVFHELNENQFSFINILM